MTELRIEDVLASPYVDPVAHLDATRVQHYVQAGEAVAPVVVFDTDEGYLLVDGYHRVAAAKLRGANTVRADLRRGSREDALRYAVELAAAERGVSLEMARARIREHSHGHRDAKPES
jgi:ParB-like chromosome segregation protein Spo0J